MFAQISQQSPPLLSSAAARGDLLFQQIGDQFGQAFRHPLIDRDPYFLKRGKRSPHRAGQIRVGCSRKVRVRERLLLRLDSSRVSVDDIVE